VTTSEEAHIQSLLVEFTAILFCLRVRTQTAFEIRNGLPDRCLPQSHRTRSVLRDSQIRHIQKVYPACCSGSGSLLFSRQVYLTPCDDFGSRAPGSAL
jgi:hypothetical protein